METYVPLEGCITTDDGQSSSEESFKALLEKLKRVSVKPVNKVEEGEEESLIADASYATDYCPVEVGIMTEDEQFSTKDEFVALRVKLRSSQGKK